MRISGGDVTGERDSMRKQRDHIGRIFDALVHGRVEEFLAACDDGLIVTAHGSSPVPATLTKRDIPDWIGSWHALTPTSLRSSFEIAGLTKDTASVLLRHSFGRSGVEYLLEMANVVTLRDGLVIEWSSYPLDLAEYSRAWRTRDTFLLASA
jgi:hypothetical protein